jgi:uncharacterized membrane protein
MATATTATTDDSAVVSSDSQPPARVAPTWTEPLAITASAVIGGPLGRHATVGRSRFWTPLRVILLAAVLTLSLGWLVKAPCLQQFPGPSGRLVLDWQADRQYVAMCYTDIVTMPAEDRLTSHELPYQARWNDPTAPPGDQLRYMDYPVVTAYFLWAVAKSTMYYLSDLAGAGLPTGLPEVVFFDLVAACFAALWLVVVWTVRRQRAERPWDAVLVAISPLALLHVFTGTDALAVAASAGALYAFSRGRSVLAGMLLGLATGAKLYAVLLLLPLLLVGHRRGQLRPALHTAIAAGLTWFAVNAPFAVLFTPGWLEPFRTGIRGGPEPDSLFFALSYFTGWLGFDGPLPPGQAPVRLNLVALGLFAVCCVGIGMLARWAPRPPRVASLCFLVVAAALLLNKSWSPQFSLWLVPLAVLALPRWRLLLAWMTVDALVWVPRMYYYLGSDDKGLPPDPFLAVVLLRDAMVLLLAVWVIRSVLRPEMDPVRALGADDPDWARPRHRGGPVRRAPAATPEAARTSA